MESLGISKILASCVLCDERALHVLGEGESQTQQCISCGYVSSERYKGTKEENEEYKKLTEDMKSWAVEKNDRIWIPTIMTLPVGMLYPMNKDDKMIWAFAPMIDIPEEERKNYPIEGQEDKYYRKRYYIIDSKTFEWFAEGLSHVNELIKEKSTNTSGGLPKLRKQ